MRRWLAMSLANVGSVPNAYVVNGGATSVSIAFNADDKNIILTIKDDGKGVSTSPIPGAGLHKFSEYGATYSFDRAAEQGAKLTVLLPIIP